MSYYYVYNDFQIIRTYGADCIKFLQGQLTNDVTRLSHNEPMQLNALCNQKGRVITLFFTRYLAQDELLFALPTALADHALSALRKYAVFSKVSFDILQDYQLVYSDHEKSPGFLFQHAIINTSETSIRSTLEVETVQKSNICQQLPIITLHNTEQFLPAELNLDQFNAVNYQKGCFMGQEIIARMKYRGTFKKMLVSIETESVIVSGDKLQDPEGKKVADVVNQVNIHNHSYILAVFGNVLENTPILLHGDIRANIIA